MKLLNLFVFLLGLMLLNSCHYQPMPAKKVKKIYLASDFLEKRDSVLFKGFYHRKGVKVVILPMTFDSIQQLLKKDPYNVPFELVLLKSTYSMHQLSVSKVLHTLNQDDLQLNPQMCSPNMDWTALGLDPFVLTHLTENRAYQYNELTYGNKWVNELTDQEFAAFQSSVLFVFGKRNLVKSERYLKKIWSQSLQVVDTLYVPDSLRKEPIHLTSLSKAIQSKNAYLYPSQNQKFGVFYDARCVGIIRHASNYTTALKLIKYYTFPKYNQYLCNKWNVLPVVKPKNRSPFAYQNNYPLMHRCSPKYVVENYFLIHQLRKRLVENETIKTTAHENS